MDWKSIYTAGKPGFSHEVFRGFKNLETDFMTGSFIEGVTYHYWIPQTFNLDDLKREIGAKQIFKFRIRFFLNEEDYITFRDRDKKNHRFTAAQEQMFRTYLDTTKADA